MIIQRFKKTVLTTAVCLSFALSTVTSAQDANVNATWDDLLESAKGQQVYFNAWGGGEQINSYIQWVANTVEEKYGVSLTHVKIGDIAEVVSQLQAAKAVGRDSDGNVDLMWVNGENFAAMKNGGLTWGAFARALPNTKYVKDTPSIKFDFSVPVDGLESPWGGAQLVFIYDTEYLKQPPASALALLEHVKAGGRFAYPAPPDFHGTTFIKQLLIELSEQSTALASPVEQADFEAVTAPLWAYLDQLHPLLWGNGESWPASAAATMQLLDDAELDIALSFNPNEASAAVKNGQLPETVRTYVFENGTIGNTHFVTIPYNAKAKAGAMIVANFLLSADAQARKANTEFWGDPTILDVSKLPAEDQARFEALDAGPWALPLGAGKTLAEPHASWAAALEQAWLERYAN